MEDKATMEPDHTGSAPQGIETATPRPSRYRVSGRGGGHRLVTCVNAPHIGISFEKGRVINPPSRFAGKSREGHIYLDGYCAGPPFRDNARRLYSLDHHEGCVRSFTLAACEQAAVVVNEGLPLQAGSWVIHLNALDPDSLLAAWVLVNFAELRHDDGATLRDCMPVIRAEGCIDGHGTGSAAISGLDSATWEGSVAILDRMKEAIAPVARAGSEEAVEALPGILDQIDAELFSPGDLKTLSGTRELGRASLKGGKLAIACESELGIWELESFLKERYGNEVAITILAKDASLYSISLSDRFFHKDLNHLYRALNRADPRVSGENRWGGSATIGGSPRETGSGLSPEALMAAVEKAFGKRGGIIGSIIDWFS